MPGANSAATSIGTTLSKTQDVTIGGSHRLFVLTQLQGTSTTTDNVSKVFPYRPAPNQTAVSPVPLTPIYNETVAVTASGGAVWSLAQYDTEGLEKVQLNLQNANAGSLNGQIDWWVA